FLAKEDQNLPAGGKIALSFILEDVLKQLYEKTNNPAYNGEFDEKPEFRRSKYDF
ncbi:MAG: hypothetical protein IH840_13570, partial [Candidatus Heimdallarchaeota archaeon]|nr:hypothetical protein [Candidatus Heimdallarchaeota archaeon]